MYSSDNIGMFISEQRSKQLDGLMEGIPHGVLLESHEGKPHGLVRNSHAWVTYIYIYVYTATVGSHTHNVVGGAQRERHC